jgi:hypothetical protein
VKLAERGTLVGGRHVRVALGFARPVVCGSGWPGGRCGERLITTHDHLAAHAVGHRLRQVFVSGGGVVGAVGSEQGRHAALLDDPVEIVHRHPGLPHDAQGAGVVALHVGVETVEAGAPPGVARVVDRRSRGEDERRARLAPQPVDDLPEVGLVLGKGHLVRARDFVALEVVQSAVEVDDVWPRLGQPVAKVPQ